eukprot:s4963_g15.t1
MAWQQRPPAVSLVTTSGTTGFSDFSGSALLAAGFFLATFLALGFVSFLALGFVSFLALGFVSFLDCFVSFLTFFGSFVDVSFEFSLERPTSGCESDSCVTDWSTAVTNED